MLSGVFLTNSVEKHDNMQIIKGLLLVESTIKIAGPLHLNKGRPCLECAVRGCCTREAQGGRAELATQGGMSRGPEQTDPRPENADKRIQSETESDRLLATDRSCAFEAQ